MLRYGTMREAMQFVWLLLLLGIHIAASHRRHRSVGQSCAQTCSGLSSEMRYESHKEYVYDVTSTASLKLMQGKYETLVTQRSRAHITKHSPCEFSLKLTGVSLTGMEVPRDWAQILERHQLRFGFDDGEVVGVCPSDGDPVWSVNLKRAILSTFQSLHESDWETDVIGECPVERENRRNGPTLMLKTTKDVDACHRQNDVSGLRAVSYRLHSKVQSPPALQAAQKCDREIRDGILQKATCTETHRIASAFSGGDSVSAHIDQTIVHATTTSSNAPLMPFSKHETIMFDHSDDTHVPKKNPRHAKANVDALCHSQRRVDSEAAATFTDLVSSLRGLTLSEIGSLSKGDCAAFVDALAICGSKDCIAQLASLINSGVASETVFSALALVYQPDKTVVDHVASFIDRVPIKGLLGVSSLVQSYCISHSNCGHEPSVKRIVDSLVAKIGRGCTVGQHFADVEKAVYVLKAVGNIAHEEISLTLLNECVNNQKNTLEVQLSAIDALRKKSCTERRNQTITQRFFDSKEDEEVRIAAFRQLMKCPDETIIGKVIDHLNNETSNQVGSYVWSYLTERRRSTKPSTEELQRILQKHHISQRFNLDSLRFSRFKEFGYLDTANNVGGHLDLSVIFSPKGYIPREVGFNFTVHLFGKSLNILELGARSEGLEQVDNSLFGPDGYISNPNGHVFREKKFRSRIDKINQLKVLYLRKSDFVEDQVSASMYLRMFGDDLKYWAFEEDNFLSKLKEYLDLDKLLPKMAKEKSYAKSRNMMLVEVRRTIPTLCGLPLQLAIDASLTSHVEFKAKLNLVDLLHQRPDADSLLESKLSASVFAASSLTLVAADVKSGMRAASTLHSSTSVSGEIQLKNGKTFTVKINLPEDDATLALIEGKFARIENNRLVPVQQSGGSDHRYCTSSASGKVTGLKMCAQLKGQYPAMKAAITVEKVDPLLKSYQFVIERDGGDGRQKLLMSVDTPGSKVNRKMETNFELSIPQKKIKMDVITPFKRISVDGNLVERRRLEDYTAKLKLNVDNKHQYELDGTFKAGIHGGRKKYTLAAKTASGSASTADLMTEVQYSGRKPNPYASIDFRLDKIFEKPIIFKTLVNLAAPQYQSKLEYSGPQFNGKLEAEATHKALLDLKGSIKGEYQVGNERKHLLNIGAEQTFVKHGKNYNLKHAANFESSSLGKFDYQIYSKVEENEMKNALEVNRGGKKSAFHIDINRNPNNIYTAIATAKCDRFGLDHRTNIVYQNKFPLQFQLKIDAESPKMKGLHASVEYAIKSDPKWNFDGKARLAYPGKEFIVTKRIDETMVGKYKMTTLVQWDRNGKIDINSDVVFRPKEHEYTLESVARVAGVSEAFHIKKHVRYHGDHYNLHWQTRHGNAVVYELIGNREGKYGSPQKYAFEVKSEKFDPKFHYHLIGDVHPTADTMQLNAVVKKDGDEFGRGNVLVPRTLRALSQKYRGEFSWKYENKQHKAMGEYMRSKDASGSKHLLTIDHNNDQKMNLQLDLLDKVHFKCEVQKGGRKVSTTELLAGPLRWDHFDLEGHVETDRPLPRRSIKTKGSFSYRPDQVTAEGRLESDGQRYSAESKWRKQREGGSRRHYTYSVLIHSPKSGFNASQQLQVERAFTIRKAQTELGVKAGGKEYRLTSDIDSDPEHFKNECELKSNAGTHVKHSTDYTHIGGRRTMKKLLKYNEKEIRVDAETIYKDGEMKVDFDLKSTLPRLKHFASSLGCEKATYWNCKIEGNVNDKYIVKGHEKLSPQKSDIGYKIQLDRFVDREGKLEYSVDKRISKYSANALMRNFDKKYHFEMNIDNDRGTLKLETPSQRSHTQMNVIRKGPEEYEFTSHTGGANKGKVHAHLKTADNDQLFKIQITEIKEPFELILKNNVAGGKQSSQAELTLDPLGTRKTYGVENIIESEGDKFRALRTTLKHPKRGIHFEILRPAQNKYAFSVQPKVGSHRRPTVAEMTYDKTSNGYHWEGSLTDEALKSPLKAKVEMVRSGHDEHNYRLNIKTEFDYSGQPDRLFSNSLRIERKTLTLHRRRRATGKDARFEAEFISTHPASNLHTRLWANIDRKDVNGALLPIRAQFGAEMNNAQKQLVKYLLSTDSDAATYTEIKMVSPECSMKARIDAVDKKHFKLAFYKDSDRASMLGEVKIHNKGVDLDVRDEKSGDVKLHASAVMPNEYTAEFEIWHSEAGKRIRDARLALELESENVLKAKTYLRPRIETDLTSKAKQAAAAAKNLQENAALKNTIVPMVESHKAVAKDVFGTLNTLVKSWLNEQREFADELGPEYRNMVNQVEEQYELFEEAVLTSYDTAQQAVEQAIASMPRSQLLENLRQFKSTGDDLSRQISTAFKPLSDLFNAYSAQLDKLQKQFAEILDYLEKNLKIDQMKEALGEYKRKFEQVDIVHEVLDKAKKLSREYQMPEVERRLHHIDGNRREYEEKAIKIYNKVKDIILDRLVVRALTQITDAVMEHIAGDAFDVTEVEKRWHDIMQYMRGKVSAETFLHNLYKKYIPSAKRIGPGEYTMEVTIIYGASSLREVIENLHPDRFVALKSALMEKARSFTTYPEAYGFGFESIYTFRSAPDKDLMPPFESIAYIVGPDRFITFDGRVFAFHAGCDYLLATDFLDQQFALIGTFANKHGGAALESIKAEILGDEIVIHTDGRVEVAGASVSLPWQKVDTLDGTSLVSVHKKGDWTILKSYIGVKVGCNSKHHLCEIILPGRMHGRSSGLLGCNDNEPANDLDLVDGTENHETNILGEHWAVRGSCRTNEALPLRSRENEKCEEMFISTSSPLRKCFSKINPTPFEQICSGGRPEDLCAAASAFVLTCDNNDIDISLPPPCVDCEHGTKLGEEKRVENARSGHDIVFVVEERSCIDPYRSNIARIGQSIAQRQRDARFGWVGFGGEGVHHSPHIQYERDGALLDVNGFVRQTQHKFETDSGFEPPPMSPLRAIQFAAKYFPFRFASTKSIVLVVCKPCTGSHSISQSELLDSVLRQGTTMHMLSLARIKTAEEANAVGMNAEYLFNEAGAHVGDRSTLLQPNDVCSVVAQESHGTVFNIKRGSNAIASKIIPGDSGQCSLCECEVEKLCVHNTCRPCNPVKPASLGSSKFSGKVSEQIDEITLDEMFFV
uniref:Vitellogenin n=2 Tax=Parascaris TaxID=6254 RepID=A0A914ZTX6_PARUN